MTRVLRLALLPLALLLTSACSDSASLDEATGSDGGTTMGGASNGGGTNAGGVAPTGGRGGSLAGGTGQGGAGGTGQGGVGGATSPGGAAQGGAGPIGQGGSVPLGGSGGQGGTGGSAPGEVVDVFANIEEDTTWTADLVYELQNTVYVKGATLTIERGTEIRGAVGTVEPAVLVVTRTGRLEARGTPTEPIVFTSAMVPGSRQVGDWGGLILLGAAPTYVGTAFIEGLPENDDSAYGGFDDAHDCASLEHVRVEFAGRDLGGGNESNGITFAGCGTGTSASHIMVNQTLDDCVEFFGGGFDLDHVVCNGFGDDGLDADRGFIGTISTALVRHTAPQTGDPNALEWDSNANGVTPPRTNVTLSDATLCGITNNSQPMYGGVLRENISGGLTNVDVVGFSFAFDQRDNSEDGTAGVALSNVTAFGAGQGLAGGGGDTNLDVAGWFAGCGSCSTVSPGFTVGECLAPGGPGATVTASGRGAFAQSSTWVDGWTSFAED